MQGQRIKNGKPSRYISVIFTTLRRPAKLARVAGSCVCNAHLQAWKVPGKGEQRMVPEGECAPGRWRPAVRVGRDHDPLVSPLSPASHLPCRSSSHLGDPGCTRTRPRVRVAGAQARRSLESRLRDPCSSCVCGPRTRVPLCWSFRSTEVWRLTVNGTITCFCQEWFACRAFVGCAWDSIFCLFLEFLSQSLLEQGSTAPGGQSLL